MDNFIEFLQLIFEIFLMLQIKSQHKIDLKHVIQGAALHKSYYITTTFHRNENMIN